MDSAAKIEAKLEELHPIHREVREKRQEWQDLQTVEAAKKVRETLLAEEEDKLATLKEQRDNLSQEKEQLERQVRPVNFSAPAGNPFPDIVNLARSQTDTSRAVQTQPVLSPDPNEEKMAARRQLKKLIGRLRFRWGLDSDVMGQINRIADDVSRPLGEALALLDWHIYENPLHRKESADEHLARLEQWGDELMAYRDRLLGEIDIQRTRYKKVLPMWELWRARDQSPEGQAAWMQFIADSRQALMEEQAQVQTTVNQLKAAIADLKASGDAASGPQEPNP